MEPKRVRVSIKCWNVTPPPAPTHVPGPIAALKVSGSQASCMFTMTSRGTDEAWLVGVELATAEARKAGWSDRRRRDVGRRLPFTATEQDHCGETEDQT